jgi:hypothetical protein
VPAAWVDVAWQAFQATPVEFCCGALFGFGLSSRYRVIRRKNGDGHD